MTDSLFRLNPVLTDWPLATVFVALVILLIWLERKKNNRYRTIRMICVVILALSLLGIALQPKIRTQKSNFTILLTDGANSSIIDSLEKEFPGAKFQFLGNGEAYPSSERISSANEITTNETKVVAGNGLSPSALDLVSNQSLVYYPAPLPSGIIGLEISNTYKAQSQGTISGVLNNTSDSVKLILEGPGGKEDSIVISKKGAQNFSLSFLPKQTGMFTYSLSVNGEKEIVPVKVESERQLKVLVIQMFPTFETGYLKNILAKDHKLVFRYQLSKNNFRYEYINHPSIKSDRLTNEILVNFDLIVIDTDALKAISASERKNLDANVSNGLGVLVLFNESPNSNRNLRSILPITFKTISKDSANFTLTRKLSLPAWPVEAVNDGTIIPTIKNKDRILSGYIYKGFGKIGFQLLQETYKLTIEGDSSSYKNLWTTIVQKNARTLSDNFRINIKNDFPIYRNEPVNIEVIGSSSTPPILLHNEIEIPMAEDVVIDDLRKTKVWPDAAGWQQIQIKGDSSKSSYYVSEDGTWKSLRIANSIRNTKAIASAKKINAITTWEFKPFAPWLFYSMFLLACAALWLVPKI